MRLKNISTPVLMSLFIALSATNLNAKTLFISDVDDTIKMTNILGKKSQVVINGLFHKKAFSGMSELYQHLKKEEDSIYYLSGSPKVIKRIIKKFLNYNEFPDSSHAILKRKISDDTFEFKYENIKKLIELEKPERLVMIGDDTEFDPEIFSKISTEFPALVDGIYIRKVQNRLLPSNEKIKSFMTPIEIAESEFTKGYLNSDEIKNVFSAFEDQKHGSGIIIKDHYCPESGSLDLQNLIELSTSDFVRESALSAQERLIKSCTSVKSISTSDLE